MTKHVFMPALSPTMEKGTLARWLITPGTPFKAGDVIAEVETDKATMEVEAVEDGVLAEILVPDGAEDVPVKTPIARLADGLAEATCAAPPAPAQSAPAEPHREPILSPAAKRVVVENNLDPAALEGSGREGRITKGDALAAVRADLASAESVSLLVRKIAEQTGLDLAGVTGSGPHGRIVKADIDKAQPGQAKTAPAAGPTAPVPAAAPRQHATLEQQGIAAGSYDLVPLDGMRKTVARRMTESFRDVPHFPLSIDVELDALLAARVRVNEILEKEGVKVSMNDMVMKAAAVALKRVPEANASYTPEGIAMHKHADIAMAVAVPAGLITPIIRKAETKGLAQIATEARDLAERARNKKLKPEEFQGGTFSVSNLGMFGIKTFASILNEPQGAILSVGVGEKRPVVRGDKLEIATAMSVTLTCDHRVVDGAIGARWLTTFKTLIEDPLGLML